jgi:hypothetical protein
MAACEWLKMQDPSFCGGGNFWTLVKTGHVSVCSGIMVKNKDTSVE